MVVCSLIMIMGEAQEKKKIKLWPSKPDVTSKVDSLTSIRDSLQALVVSKDSLIKSLSKIPDTVLVYGNDSIKIAELTDSLSLLGQKLSYRDSVISRLSTDLGYADTCMITLAYRRCHEKFNKSNIEKAISFFPRLHTKQLKSDREKDLLPLLKEYEQSYNEIISILTRAQNDQDRLDNPFVEEDFKKKYIEALKRSRYYTKYYTADWKIMYLNNLIDESIELLEKHTSTSPVNFEEHLK